MHSTLFALFAFASTAFTASIPRAASELKPFEISGLNFTQSAGSDTAAVRFYVNDLNTNDLTICGDDDVLPNQLRFCNGIPQYVFGSDFKTLAVSWLWLPNGVQNHTAASVTTDIALNCVDDSSEQGKKQCHADTIRVVPTIVAP
ncbi:hypothetical protein UCRNP2_3278 [Neofusicoccum parvum UCRNP2]|uniref:AA1-like domain-containing protein n=1 Tax=Botryosphaeria parva (strain UCR-NP2) TaxID=1287680 RepID=R1GV53_BOTPV|nr:hypothetical protein UCRNP2_3278 [Neofusicoccum parvum UCRNP2]